MLGFGLTVCGRTYLVDLQTTTGTPHTAENLAEMVDSCMCDLENDLGVRITVLGTDSASNMEKMRDIV